MSLSLSLSAQFSGEDYSLSSRAAPLQHTHAHRSEFRGLGSDCPLFISFDNGPREEETSTRTGAELQVGAGYSWNTAILGLYWLWCGCSQTTWQLVCAVNYPGHCRMFSKLILINVTWFLVTQDVLQLIKTPSSTCLWQFHCNLHLWCQSLKLYSKLPQQLTGCLLWLRSRLCLYQFTTE